MTTIALRRRAGRSGSVALGVVAVLALIGLFAPWVSPHDPNAITLTDAFQGMSAQHPLGTDASGRDLLSRLIWGARSSLAGPLLAMLLATVLGVVIAVVAAWRGGWVDAIISRSVDVLFAFPGVLLAVLVVALFGAGLQMAIAALAVSYVPYIARVVRGAALSERSKPYIMALTIQGVGGFAICARHLVPNLMRLILAQATLTFAYAMVDLAALSFLGLGVQPPTADWGVMVADGQPSVLEGFPQESLFAGALIVVVVAAFNLLGDRLDEWTW